MNEKIFCYKCQRELSKGTYYADISITARKIQDENGIGTIDRTTLCHGCYTFNLSVNRDDEQRKFSIKLA